MCSNGHQTLYKTTHPLDVKDLEGEEKKRAPKYWTLPARTVTFLLQAEKLFEATPSHITKALAFTSYDKRSRREVE